MTDVSSSGCHKCKDTIADLRAQLAKLSLMAEEQSRIQLEVCNVPVWSRPDCTICSVFCILFQTAQLYSISPWALAVKRVPALVLTMALELVGGVVIDQLHRVLYSDSTQKLYSDPIGLRYCTQILYPDFIVLR